MNYDLTQLTAGERLLLWRLRQPAPNIEGERQGRNGRWLSIDAAAEQLTVRPGKWRNAEQGFDDEAAEEFLGELYERELKPSNHTTADLCRIARQRSEMGLEELCATLGVSKPWFYVMERSGDERVVEFWIDMGFVFK